jgi:hypothetical protein
VVRCADCGVQHVAADKVYDFLAEGDGLDALLCPGVGDVAVCGGDAQGTEKCVRVTEGCGYPVFSQSSCSKIPAAVELQFFHRDLGMAGLEHRLDLPRETNGGGV